MKNTFIRSILALVMAFMALPMMGQDYLKIYFKDGHTERHFMHLVNNIAMTKYDLEGNLHSDYQMQQIVMEDTTYSYYLADIDSMTFRKVDEEMVRKYVETITNTVTPIFNQCSTAEELEEHLDEIKNIEGVEDAFRSGTDIIVKVRDWHDYVFMYPAVSEDESSSIANIIKTLYVQHINPQRKVLKEDETAVNVAIAFQMVDDPRFKDEKEKLEELKDQLKVMGFNAVFIPSEEGGNFDIDFYRRRMFEYDIVLLDTHGGYNEEKDLHSFLTGERYIGGAADLWLWNKLGLPSLTDIDDTYISSCQTGYLPFTSGIFRAVTQNFISKSSSKFGDGDHIVFNGACNSLNGKGTLERHDGQTFPGGDVVAQIFHRKGANVYMGYNNICTKSSYAAYNYFQYLLSGYSHESAFDNIPDDQKDEQTKWQASLIDVFSPNSKKDLFILKTHTIEKTEQEFNYEYNKFNKIELEGLTHSYYRTGITFGFRLAKEPNVDQLEEYQYDELTTDKIQYTGSNNGEVFFSVDAFPYPGTTVYYRAFTYDGIYYNWGEEKTFTINQLSVSTNYISLEAGWTRTVDITSGSGSYLVESSDEHIATAFVDGNTISVNALTPGDAKITVYDKITGSEAAIMVTVTGQTDTRELMITKTVNKTVYSIYKRILDENDYRTNPDGWNCYRSELVLDIIKDGNTESYVIDDNIYLDKQGNHHSGQQPCMLLDFNKNMIGVFCNSKGYGYNYQMDGYYYYTSMDGISFTKETVFDGANWGWFPYFRDYGDDNVYLCNFSYGGYFTILAVRENGSWDLYYDNQDISAEAAQQIWERIGSVLVIGDTPDDEVDDRIHTVIPEEIRDVIDEYIPIYDGMNPPNIEGSYYLNPQILIGSSLSYDQVGTEYAPEYQKYGNQDMVNNTIDMVRVQGRDYTIEWDKGSGAFISGTGNYFTIYFDMEGESYGIMTKMVYIVSGTKTDTGIKNLTAGFILKEKGDDPEGTLVPVGTFRFFTDQDGMCETTTWPYGDIYGSKKHVKNGLDLPGILERGKTHLTPVK